MSLPKLINTLINEFISERLITPGSSKTYRITLNVWVRWMVQNGGITMPTAGQIVSWVRSLEEEKWSQLTIENSLNIIRMFFRWMKAKGYYEDVAKTVTVRRADREIRRGYIKKDVLKVWLNSLQSENIIQKRNKAIINLMVRTGFRCVEISRFDIGDIQKHDDRFAIRIQRKGHKEKDQSVGVPSLCIELINEYLKSRGSVPGSAPLFASHCTGKESGRLLPTSVSQLVKNELIAAGLKSKMITPHSLRHCAAVFALEMNVPEYEIRLMMGHSSSSTTARYLRLIGREKMELNIATQSVCDYLDK